MGPPLIQWIFIFVNVPNIFHDHILVKQPIHKLKQLIINSHNHMVAHITECSKITSKTPYSWHPSLFSEETSTPSNNQRVSCNSKTFTQTTININQSVDLSQLLLAMGLVITLKMEFFIFYFVIFLWTQRSCIQEWFTFYGKFHLQKPTKWGGMRNNIARWHGTQGNSFLSQLRMVLYHFHSF